MMMINYLLIDILIIIFPLLLSFKWKFAYYRYFKALFPAIAIVVVGYIILSLVAKSLLTWHVFVGTLRPM